MQLEQPRVRRARTAACGSRSRDCRTSRTSTTSIRCGMEPEVRARVHRGRASRCRSMRTSSSCPAARRRSPTSSSSARRAGTSTCTRTSAAAGACSASAPAIRCSASSSTTRSGSKGDARSCAGLDLLDVHYDHDAEQKTLRAVAGVELATGARIARLRNASRRDERTRRVPADDPLRRRHDRRCCVGGRPHRGCHVHGLFAEPAFRIAYLATLGARSAGEDHAQRVERALDEIATALESALAIDRLLRLASAL